MSRIITLNSLPVGGTGLVTDIKPGGLSLERFWEFGLVRGTPIKALQKSPFGNPTAYGFRGSVIALRDIDAEKVLVICDG